MKKLLPIYFLLFAILHCEAQSMKKFRIIMRNTGTITLWDGKTTTLWGFATNLNDNPSLPGPTITVDEGDSAELDVQNISQGDPHTVHLHGLDVDQENDGVPQTSFALGHMEKNSYKFYAAHAGTYLYHCHVLSVVHVQMGMYGLVVVKAKNGAKTVYTGGPSYEREFSWLTSELDKAWHDNVPGGNMHHDSMTIGHDTVRIPPYNPAYFLVSGKSGPQLRNSSSQLLIGKGETVLLRLANIGFFTNEIIFPSYLNCELIQSDGRPLPKTIREDTVRLYPGERYDVLLHSDTVMTDSVAVHYINMNTHQDTHIEYVPAMLVRSGIEAKTPPLTEALVYPNPATDLVTISLEGENEEIKRISLYNASGGLISEQNIFSPTCTLETGKFKAGVYFLRIRTGKSVICRQLVISR